MNKTEHVNIFDLPDFLVEDLGIDMEDPLSFFEGDPDMIKVLERIEYFCLYEYEGTTYIISTADSGDCMDDIFIELLDKFVEGSEFWENPDHETWDAYDSADIAIAFRNGSGYSYSIFEYTEPLDLTKYYWI